MKIKALSDIPNLILLTKDAALEREFNSVYIGDLLSVVLAKASAQDIWITVQAHKNIVGVASIKGIPAIIIAEDFRPDEDTLSKAREEDIAVFSSPEPIFKIAGYFAAMRKERTA